MQFLVYMNNQLIGTIYAPNIGTAELRAAHIYGNNVSVEEK